MLITVIMASGEKRTINPQSGLLYYSETALGFEEIVDIQIENEQSNVEKAINAKTAYRYIKRFEGHLLTTDGGLIVRVRLLNKHGFRKARIGCTFDELKELHQKLDKLQAEWEKEKA